MNKHLIVSVVSLCIAGAVVLSSVHPAQLASAAQLDKKTTDNVAVKIHTELHDHVDKPDKLVKDMPQIDARSLRLREHKRHTRPGPLHGLLGLLRNHLSLFV